MCRVSPINLFYFLGFFYYLFRIADCVDSSKHSDDTTKATKGTLYEVGGDDCDESCKKELLKTSTYVKIYMFTSDQNKKYPEIVYRNVTSLKLSGFNATKKTKLIVHGWRESGFEGHSSDLRDAYVATHADVNILTVNWSKVTGQIYPLALLNLTPVAKFMAEFFDWLSTVGNVTLDSIHMIGLSFGAHLAGIIGQHVTTGKIGRITGLDPSAPGFATSASGRLDSSDAQFVDVIHTCGGWAGYYDPCGHVDFYPNKGTYNQPGCGIDIGTCSHKRSYDLFFESISSEGFVAKQCDNWDNFSKGKCDNHSLAVMGEHVDQSKRNKFYLRTAAHHPYALGNTKGS